ncbi:MAG TPA: CHASE2 domain-containing protein, partial [Gammaproteobacteria bacterium]
MDKGNIHKPPSRSTVYLTSAAIAVALFLLLASVYLVRPQILEDVEGRLLDARFQLRGAVETSGLVTLVAVDEKSLEAYGRWPWSREVLAALIERLSEMGAGAIGLDIVFSEAQPSALESLLATRPAIDAAERERLRRLLGGESPDAALAGAIRRSGRVVNGHFFYTSAETARELEPLPPELEVELLARSGVDAVRAFSDAFPARDAVAVRMNIPELARAGNGAGFFNFVPGRDGIVRSASLLLRYRDEFYPSLALKTLALYLERAPIVVHAREYGIDHLTLGGIAIPTDEVGGFVLNYRGPPGTIPGHSAADILQGRVPAEAIAGKLVLLGVSAIGVYDAHSTPFGPSFPGVEIQANVAENILLGDYIHHSGMELLVDLLAIFLILFLLAMVLPLLR